MARAHDSLARSGVLRLQLSEQSAQTAVAKTLADIAKILTGEPHSGTKQAC
jgi:hypothetical protein